VPRTTDVRTTGVDAAEEAKIGALVKKAVN
jgi:hypothetical protein